MSNLERLIVWPVGITLLLIGFALYALWCGAQSIAAFADWVREDA